MARPATIQITHNPDTLWKPFALNLEPPDWTEGSYTDEIRDVGGFWQCEFKMIAGRGILEEMFENGLDRSVKPIGQSGKTLWEGYINEMVYQIGGVQLRRRLGRMANQVWVRYTDGVTSGLRSDVFDDVAQQNHFGIKQRIYSGSKMLGLSQANQAAEVIFNSVRTASNPSVTNLAKASDEISLTVQCNGWFHKFYWQVYNNPSGSGTIAAYALIEAMLASWSGILPVDHQAIERNDTPLQAKVDADMYIGDQMTGAADMGDQYLRRWIIGMYEKRTLRFESAAASKLL